jgi:hypothetical protein
MPFVVQTLRGLCALGVFAVNPRRLPHRKGHFNSMARRCHFESSWARA